MTTDARLELPGSGYDVITKILHAYALCGDKAVALYEVAQKAGMHKTQVSKNNGFLASIGVITGGKNKQLTEEGKALVLAVANKLEDDIVRQWERVLMSSPSTSSIIDMIRVQGSLSRDTLLGKTASILGLVDDKTTRTGLNCLFEIFQKSGLLIERDGKFSLSDTAKRIETESKGEQESLTAAHLSLDSSKPVSDMHRESLEAGPTTGVPSLHIDIQIHIDANASPEQVDQIFASMAKHLYGRA